MRLAVGGVLAVSLVTVGVTQIKEVIKVLGVGAAVKQFAPEINRQFNKLTKHTDTPTKTTKVVPIIALGSRGAIGAAQVTGPKASVNKVEAVASPEIKLFGEILIRALIPVSSKNVSDIKTVDGVGVTGIVDIRL